VVVIVSYFQNNKEFIHVITKLSFQKIRYQLEEKVNENIPLKLNIDEDMEEGEISDDEMDLPEVLERPLKLNVLPDLLKDWIRFHYC
jgi:hypothetical protein